MKKNKIILVGYRATGKSSLAKLIAERLGWEWLDTDPLIEERAGKSIAKIFAEEGETHFRDLEEMAVADVLRETKSLVVATGGGVPLRERSRKLLRDSGIVFWLQAKPKTIYERMNGDATTADRRPALTDLSALDEIKTVLANRQKAYQECAHHVIDTDGSSLDTLAQYICELSRSSNNE